MKNELAKNIMFLGIDGLDPRLTRKYVDEGKMPNVKKFMELGSTRADIALIGGQPTVTPPMWTTLATGANPSTHGITCYFRQSEEDLDVIEYNFGSNNCKAEQLWNVFAEAGKKTLVWHWPGSSWPPTRDDEYLYVVDGTQPGGANVGIAEVDTEKLVIANINTEQVAYKNKLASDSKVDCMISDMEIEEKEETYYDMIHGTKVKNIILTKEESISGLSEIPLDIVFSPIKLAQGWANAPQGAKEFTILYNKSLLRRPALILRNENGTYDKVAIYKNKKATEPIAILESDVFKQDVIDEAIKNDVTLMANRNMRLIELAENGDSLKLWISPAMDFHNDSLWWPKSLLKTVVDNCGYPQPICLAGGSDEKLISNCMAANWDASGNWQARSLKYLMRNEGFQVVFSHFHNVDMQGHMLVKYFKNGGKLPPEKYQKLFEDVYVQTDNYIGHFLEMIDEGWTIIIASDHGQACPEHYTPCLGFGGGVNVEIMRELGFTEVLKDENGNDMHEIDWAKTIAVAVRGNHIYLNLKGRNKHGIVDPKDKYEVEEKIMTGLYGYRDKETGHRMVALALRNHDAVLLGMGGPDSGDILYWNAAGWHRDHCDTLSTTQGVCDTSVSSVFMAAGPGVKKGYLTDRVIRHVDVTPTMAVLGGVRMPRQCEGAPVYQIIDHELFGN